MSKFLNESIFNPQFWHEYENCLIKIGVQPDQIRWYVNWCQQFSKFIGRLPVTDCKPEHVTVFLDTLRDNPAIKDWQQSQARTALWHLFRDQIKIFWATGTSTQHTPAAIKTNPVKQTISPSHQETLQKLRSTLTGRMYAKRTIAAYMDWATRFLSYYPHRKIADLDAISVKSYLTYLVEKSNVGVNTQKQA